MSNEGLTPKSYDDDSKAPVRIPDKLSQLPPTPPMQTTSDDDITDAYFLRPGSVRNYNALTEQLLEDHQRPVRTKVHMDVNLSVDLDLSPEVHGDLHLSMLCVTVKRKPWEEDVISSDGRRIAGTVLRISDGGGRLVHRQVVGFESFGEWWWVVRTQLQELVRRKVVKLLENAKKYLGDFDTGRLVLLSAFPVTLLAVLLWGAFAVVS